MWFWNVEAGDTLDKEGRSHVNLPEVNAVLALVRHLLRSGVEPQMITVLAPYAAQVEILGQRGSR
jgi:superfamily I DNA and/or RNA helicase